jgi:uncharacterized protein (DUF952 family)
VIFKICHRSEWAEAERAGSYSGSAKDCADGFLHFSTAEQVMGTLRRHYANETDLLLIAVDPALLGATLKYEPSRDGALFPHHYGTLPLAAVLWARPLTRDRAGGFILPALDA